MAEKLHNKRSNTDPASIGLGKRANKRLQARFCGRYVKIGRRAMHAKILLIAVLIFCVASCANPLNRTTYQRYHAQGAQAERIGDTQLAETAYSRALANVYLGNLGSKVEAEALFNLGRMERFTGKLDSSIEHLQKSLEIDEADSSSNPLHIQNTLAELSKSFLLKSKLARGLPYLERSLSISPVSSATPQVQKFLSNLCKDYIESLIAHGRDSEAEALKGGSCLKLL